MKILLSINICFFALGISAERLTLHRPEDARSNLLFSQLPQYCGSAEQLLASTTSAAYALLSYMGPSIKLLPSYTGIFTGNCSIFFDSIVEEVACDINPSTAQTLTTGSVIIPGTPLPEQYQNQITQSHILRTNIFADWRGRKQQEFETDVHFRINTYSSTESKSPLETQSESTSISQSISPTLKATQSFVSSLSDTLARLSKTPLETLSASYSALSATASSNTPSISSTHTGSSSKSPSGTLSKTQTFSLLLSKTATDILSASETRSKSGSLSKTGTVTGSLTAEPSLSESLTSSSSLSPTRPNGLFAACYNAGGIYADATNQASRYTVSNGVVTDTLTQIQWEQNASSGTMNWTDAARYCTGRNTGGLTGWHVPNIGELQTLVDFTITAPSINATFFSAMPLASFWSSTLDTGYSGNSWELLFASGGPSYGHSTTNLDRVRCARSYYQTPTQMRNIVASGTVTDTVTGLIWQQASRSGIMTYASALTSCTGLNLGSSSSGWRLPTIRELSTLIDYSINMGNLMMDTTAFAGEPAEWFWASTPLAGSPSNAWSI
ncbi:MAG: DUF1566 domain-containing protein, partial [Myxococcaceae bacterium]